MFVKTSAVPVLDFGNAYHAADNVGALLTFAVATGVTGPRGATIRRLSVIDADIEDAELWLHLFTASPAAGCRTDDAAYLPIAADLVLKICSFHIPAADYDTGASDSIATYELDTAIVFDGLNIYGVLECVGTPTYTAVDDLTVNLIVEV